MTDEEVICEWMEPKPADKNGGSWCDWWERTVDGPRWTWKPTALTLDRLHEVEGQLSDEQWGLYLVHLCCLRDKVLALRKSDIKFACHANADQKIAALAAVIRADTK